MFRPNNNQVTAPVTTAIFVLPAQNTTVSDYLENFKATDLTTKGTIGGIIHLLALESLKNPPVDNQEAADLIANCDAMFSPGAAAAFNALVTAGNANPPNDNDIVKAAIITNEARATNWVADLVNAAKKKPLDEGNVEGYFAMLGHSGTKSSAVASLINRMTPFFPDMIADQAFRGVLANGVWTTYRTTRVSTGVIINKLLEDFTALGIVTAGGPVETAIRNSAAAPWDVSLANQIPEKIKAYACIFLEVSGTPIDSWYQGNKARDNLPAVKVRGAKEIFRRYLEVKNNVAGINNINTVAGFQDPAVAGFF